MNADQSKNPSSEQRLNEILAQFLEAERTGQAPTADKLKRQNPDLANEIDSFFANRDHFQQLAGGDDTATIPPQSKIAQDASTLGPDGSAPAAGGTVRYFGDYELLEEIARGGMGVVFKARQVSLNRTVALKMILAGNLASEDDVQRFRREAEAAAKLDHPNIVPIYEVGQHEGQQYFSMKLVEGGSLAEILSRRGAENAEKKVDSLRNPRLCVRLLTAIARAVHHAHLRGILHRDLKPGNILIDQNGEPLVTDFGLAKKVEGDAGLTRSGAIVGTPAYMAPEQASAEKDLTVAADVYSLGAIMYEMLTGKPPFRAETPLEVVLQVLEREPEPLRRIKPEIDRDLETICLKCLQKEPAKRYGAAEELAVDLENWLAGKPINARPVGQVERAWRWCRRNPVVAAMTVVINLLLLAATIGMTSLWLVADQNWQRANSNLAAAKAAQALAQANAADANAKAREIERQSLYARTSQHAWFLSKAQRELDDRNFSRALSILNQCSPKLCGWEHEFLAGRCRRKFARLHRSTLPVQAVAFSSNGKFLAAGSAGSAGRKPAAAVGEVRIWKSSTRKPVDLLRNVRVPVLDLAFVAGDKMLAVLSNKKHGVQLYDIASGSLVRSMPGFFCFAASADGEIVASCTENEKELFVVAWRVRDGKEILRWKCPNKNWGLGLALSANGQLLAVTNADPVLVIENGGAVAKNAKHLTDILLLDVNLGKLAGVLEGHRKTVLDVVFSPDGAQLASASADGTVKVWDLKSKKSVVTIRPASGGGVNHVQFSPDGKNIAAVNSGSFGIIIWLWEAKTGKSVLEFREENTIGSNLAYAPSGQFLAAVAVTLDDFDPKTSSRIRLWHIGEHEVTTVNESINVVLCSPDGKFVCLAGVTEQPGGKQIAEFIIRDLATEKDVITWRSALNDEEFVGLTRFDPKGELLAVSKARLKNGKFQNVSLEIMDFPSLRKKAVLKGFEEPIIGLCFGHNGEMIATASERVAGPQQINLDLSVWKVESKTKLFKKSVKAPYDVCLALSPSGDYFAAAAGRDEVHLWHVESGKPAVVLGHNGAEIHDIQFSNDGSLVATADGKGVIRLWHGKTGQLMRKMTDRRPVHWIAFSPDCSRIASAAFAGLAVSEFRIWDVVTGQEMHSLGRLNIQTLGLNFSPDGKRLCASGTAAIIWDAATGRIQKIEPRRK